MMATKTKYTYEDYEAFPDDGNRYEIIDGEVYVTAAPFEPHQWAVGELQRLLGNYVMEHRLGRVYPAPFAVVLGPHDVVEPDVIYISRARLDIIDHRGRVRGAPDLCIEVASPSTRRVDRVVKFARYAQFGIPEYWIVDPATQRVDVFTLDKEAYVLVAGVQGNDRIPSRLLPGLTLRPDDLFIAPTWDDDDET